MCRDADELVLELFGFFQRGDILVDHQRHRFRRVAWVVSHLGWHTGQEAPAERHGIHQHRKCSTIRVTDGLLMVAHRFSLVYGAQGGECGGSKRLAIRAEQTNVVGGEKVQHRLTGVPCGSPDGGRGTIGQHEAGFFSLHDIDAGGQFIQNQLQDRQACFGCLSGRTLPLFQATALGDITNGSQHMQRVIERERTQADVHRKLRAIFASTIQLQPLSHGTGARRGGITLTMESMGSMKAFRQEDFQLLPDEFGASVAKQPFHLAIHERDTSGRIDHDQRIGRDVQQCEEGCPASLPLQRKARRTWRMK